MCVATTVHHWWLQATRYQGFFLDSCWHRSVSSSSWCLLWSFMSLPRTEEQPYHTYWKSCSWFSSKGLWISKWSGVSWRKLGYLALPILALASASFPPYVSTTLPRYVKCFTSSVTPSILQCDWGCTSSVPFKDLVLTLFSMNFQP